MQVCLHSNEWSKNIDKRPHCEGGTFFMGDNVMASREHCSRLQQSRHYAVIEDRMIPVTICHYWLLNDPFCCTHCIRDSQCFSLGLATPKIALSLGDLDLHLIHGSLGPHESAPNGISIGSAVFAQLTRVPNTQTHSFINFINPWLLNYCSHIVRYFLSSCS